MIVVLLFLIISLYIASRLKKSGYIPYISLLWVIFVDWKPYLLYSLLIFSIIYPFFISKKQLLPIYLMFFISNYIFNYIG